MAEWKYEPDTEVRRIAFIGLIQAITRHQQAHDAVAGDRTVTPEMEWLRQEIRRDLCAYGPELEERRQLAWIGMLMLGDLTLIDGIEETIGHPGAPGVKLEVLYDGDVDQILVDLVAENWDRLRAHFGEAVFDRLNGKSDSRRRTAGEQRLHVMSALATAASRHPRRRRDAPPRGWRGARATPGPALPPVGQGREQRRRSEPSARWPRNSATPRTAGRTRSWTRCWTGKAGM